MGLLDRVLGFFGTDEQTDAALSEKPSTNLMDLPNDQFQAALSELGLEPEREAELQRKYREKDSVFSPVYDTVNAADAALAEEGRTRSSLVPMSKPEGMSGWDAFTSGEADLAFPAAATEGTKGFFKGLDAPVAAAKGQIPMQDMASEATGTTSAMMGISPLFKVEDGAQRIFLPRSAPNVDQSALKRAETMEAQGYPRDDIWRDTLWGRINNEWVTEVDDSKSLTADLQPFRNPTETVVKNVSRTLKPEERISAKVAARQQVLSISKQMRDGVLSKDEGLKLVDQLEKKLSNDLQSTVEAKEVIQQVAIGPLKQKGRLEEVLFHPDLYKAIKDPNTTFQSPTAEAGFRLSTDGGGTDAYGGLHYGKKWTDDMIAARGHSRINSFKDNATPAIAKKLDQYANDPADKKLHKDFVEGKISLDEVQADIVWSVMLHETQHFVDDMFESTGGRGFHYDNSPFILSRAKDSYDDAMLSAFKSPEAKSARTGLQGMVGKVDEPTFQEVTDALRGYNDVTSNGILSVVDARINLRQSVKDSLKLSDADADGVVGFITNDPYHNDLANKLDSIKQSTVSKLLSLPSNDSKILKMQVYARDAGEAKARLAQARRSKTSDQRRQDPPWYDMDVPDRELFNGSAWHDGKDPFAATVQTDQLLRGQ